MKANLRLTVQRQTREESQYDEHPEAWEDVRVEWFAVQPLSAREFVQNQQIQSNVTHKADCPWFEGANSSLRLVNGSRVFHVQSVTNRNEGNRKLDWMLVESNG